MRPQGQIMGTTFQMFPSNEMKCDHNSGVCDERRLSGSLNGSVCNTIVHSEAGSGSPRSSPAAAAVVHTLMTNVITGSQPPSSDSLSCCLWWQSRAGSRNRGLLQFGMNISAVSSFVAPALPPTPILRWLMRFSKDWFLQSRSSE